MPEGEAGQFLIQGIGNDRLEGIEPMAYRLLVNFAMHNELRVRKRRIDARAELAEPQRVGYTA